MLEALSNAGVDALTILRRHSADPDYHDVSLRNFLQRYYSPLPRNAFLQAEYLRVGNFAAQLLFETNLGPSSRDEIAKLAYKFFEARGRVQGHDLDDWLQAERRLAGR